jgi:hypothetical protein
MAVRVTPKFKSGDIKKLIDTELKKREEVILLRLLKIGEDFVTNARTNGTYIDRTGNLRSSVGYLVLRNGEQYHRGGFQLITTGSTGITTGRVVLEEVGANYPTGLVLIVVAGMSYAAAVEAKGRDVLTGSSQIAVIELKAAMDRISKAA